MLEKALNRTVAGVILAAVVFGLLGWLVPADKLILVLNGLFAGTAAAILVAFGKLLANAVMGVRPYDRVRQMTLGFFLCWVAYTIGVVVSIYFRSADIFVNSSYGTAAGRYIAIIAAVLQVTAPDFGLGIFHGRERKVLATGFVVGGLVAIGTILSQYYNVLTYWHYDLF